METDPHPVIEPVSLATNDGMLNATPISLTAAENDMEVSEHIIEGPMSLSNSPFVNEDQRYRPYPNNLEEGGDMPEITSV